METISEVNSTARKASREPTEAVEINFDDDFVTTSVEAADKIPVTSTPPSKAAAPPSSISTAEPPSTEGEPADF